MPMTPVLFSCKAIIMKSWPPECSSLTYDPDGFNCRVNWSSV